MPSPYKINEYLNAHGGTAGKYLLLGGLIGGILSATGTGPSPVKMRGAGILGACLLGAGVAADYVSQNRKTNRPGQRLYVTSDLLSTIGGLGVGALAGSKLMMIPLVNLHVPKGTIPANFNGDPYDRDPIVLAAQRL